ncbi:MAG: mechanosensitive ion channel protein MscS, partial [Bradyrhizobium sp.]
MDLNDVIEYLRATARSVGAEVSSPWFYLQFGLILTAAGIAFAANRALQARVNND